MVLEDFLYDKEGILWKRQMYEETLYLGAVMLQQ